MCSCSVLYESNFHGNLKYRQSYLGDDISIPKYAIVMRKGVPTYLSS